MRACPLRQAKRVFHKTSGKPPSKAPTSRRWGLSLFYYKQVRLTAGLPRCKIMPRQ
nr:MAG TPA: hypothetical protein [Caudoviricetes sp.]